MRPLRKSYSSDVTDEEWAFCAPYLTLMKEEAPQRDHPWREVFNGLHYLVHAGCTWRLMPHDFASLAHDLRALLRLLEERNEKPSAVILDSRTIQSTPESGQQAGFDGHKKRKGSKVHIAVDTLGHLLALKVTPANEQDRAQQVTQENVQVAFVDQGYAGEEPMEAAQAQGIRLEVV
jgi:transposase